MRASVKHAVALGALLSLASAVPATGFPGGGTELTTRPRHRVDRIATFTFDNVSGEDVTMEGPWTIERRGSGEVVATYVWPEEQLVVAPDETRVWQWTQTSGCHGECDGSPGETVGPGRYLLRVPHSKAETPAPFSIGEYFTLGFTSRPALEFTVFVNTPAEVEQMRAEVDAEQKQIVSGIVRRGRPYNPEWNFTMAPSSIVLGEVFIEVCDASPGYVQRHRSEWLGQRWCPWSSYVKRVGR